MFTSAVTLFSHKAKLKWSSREEEKQSPLQIRQRLCTKPDRPFNQSISITLIYFYNDSKLIMSEKKKQSEKKRLILFTMLMKDDVYKQLTHIIPHLKVFLFIYKSLISDDEGA